MDGQIVSVHQIIAGVAMEAKSIVTQQSSPLNLSQAKVESSASVPMLPMVSCIAVMTAVAVSIYACISRERHKSQRRAASPKAFCHSCEYFNHSLYLNCALHPSKALTESALDCADYSPNSQTKKARELKKSLPFMSKIFPE